VRTGPIPLAESLAYSLQLATTTQKVGPFPLGQFSGSARNLFPSSAFVRINGAGVGPVTVIAEGQKPSDDFSGYQAFGGDYSAAVGAPDGSIVVSSEWIPGTFGFIPPSTVPLSFLANWGTFIANIQP
jgi:hypothetical protein